MRKLLTFLIALAVTVGVAASSFGQGFNGGGFNIGLGPFLPGGGYQGPGDIVSGATEWYGLRAYSSADRGNKLINACNIADAACADISSDASTGKLTNFASVGGTTCSYAISSGTYTTATGAVSLTMASGPGLASTNILGVTNFTGTGNASQLSGVYTAASGTTGTTVNFTAATGLGTISITGGTLSVCSIKSFYDRSGALSCSAAACDMTTSAIANRAFLIGSCINSLPCAVFGGAAFYGTAAVLGTWTSGSVSSVALRTGLFTTAGFIQSYGTTAGSQASINFRALANAIQMFQGSSGQFISNITDSNFHALQAIFNGASGNLMCGGSAGTSCSTAGTNNAINPGTTATGANSFLCIGVNASGICSLLNSPLVGLLTETGTWKGIVFSGTQQTNITSNEYAFWGPF
jgi:hypothetical protein